MAIARQGSADLGNNSGAAGSWTSPAYVVNAASNCVVLSVCGANPSSGSGNSITGATYGGVAMTQAPGAPGFAGTFPASARCQNLFYLFNPPTGSNTFVISQASSGFADNYILALAADYSGVNTSGLDSTAAEHDSGGAAVSSLSNPVTVNTAGAWVVSTIGGNTLNTCTNTALTKVVDGAAFTFPFLFDSNAGINTVGSFTNTYDFSANGEPGIAAGAVVLALKPALASITASLAETGPNFTLVGHAALTPQASLVVTGPNFTLAGTAVFGSFSASLAEVGPNFTLSGAGTVVVSAALAETAPNFTLNGTATIAITAALAVVSPNFTLVGHAVGPALDRESILIAGVYPGWIEP